MISTKEELKYYLELDKKALGKRTKHPSVFGDDIWKFQIIMRKLDYYTNKNLLKYFYYRFKFHNMSIRLGFSIPCNVIGPGLSIVHYGNIVISSGCNIGKNCRIHSGVNIGANAGERKAATIGDNVYIGPGAKIIGCIKIGNNSVIGANAVVTKNVPDSVTVGGIPARIISENDSSRHIAQI